MVRTFNAAWVVFLACATLVAGQNPALSKMTRDAQQRLANAKAAAQQRKAEQERLAYQQAAEQRVAAQKKQMAEERLASMIKAQKQQAEEQRLASVYAGQQKQADAQRRAAGIEAQKKKAAEERLASMLTAQKKQAVDGRLASASAMQQRKAEAEQDRLASMYAEQQRKAEEQRAIAAQRKAEEQRRIAAMATQRKQSAEERLASMLTMEKERADTERVASRWAGQRPLAKEIRQRQYEERLMQMAAARKQKEEEDPHNQMASQLMRGFDANQDGKISLQELMEHVGEEHHQAYKGWHTGFRQADADRDMHLTTEELADLLKAATNDEEQEEPVLQRPRKEQNPHAQAAKSIMQTLDANRDGKISLQELMSVLNDEHHNNPTDRKSVV